MSDIYFGNYHDPCLNSKEMGSLGYTIVEDSDGRVRVYNAEGYEQGFIFRKECCESLGYIFDDVNQKCLWKTGSTSTEISDFKLRLNPVGNNSVNFNFNDNEVCCIDVSLDYIIRFTCDDIINGVYTNGNCDNVLDVFENIELYFNIDLYNSTDNKYYTVFEDKIFSIGSGNLWNYILSTSGNTGFIISGSSGLMPGLNEFSSDSTIYQTIANGYNTPTDCNSLRDNIISSLYNEIPEQDKAGLLNSGEIYNIIDEWWNSCWISYSNKICDKDLLNEIKGGDITFSIKVLNSCSDFSLFLDKIKIIKSCDRINNREILISEPPKFNIKKVVDNKKSWVVNNDKHLRKDLLKGRETEYYVNNSSLVLNTKEIDLSLTSARGVEKDLWCYVNDNYCLLEGCYGNADNFTYSAFTCPSGYTLTSGSDSCQKLTYTGATDNTGSNVYTVGVANLSRNYHFLMRGTIFVYEDLKTNDLPISWEITPQDTWVGPYYNVNYLANSNGDYLLHDAFGEEYDSNGNLIYSSPSAFSGPKSEFGISSDDYVNGKPNPNILWGGTPNSVGSSSFVDVTGTNNPGRLLNAGVWTNPINEAKEEWIGFSHCFTLSETKIYRIGFAADDKIRIKINGKWLYNPDLKTKTPKPTNNSILSSYSREIQMYVVVGYKLNAGKNIIEVEGWNKSSFVGFSLEIYDASVDELKNIRYESELKSVTIFSTKDKIGDIFQLGENSGYSCPDGYSLDTCSSTYSCVKIDETTREETQKSIIECCCPGTPLLAKSYNGNTLELFTITGDTIPFDCNVLSNKFDNNKMGVIPTINNCGNIYDIGDKTFIGDEISNFEGFWIGEESDRTISVYYVNYISGGTSLFENKTEYIDETCCKIINDKLREQEDKYNQGVEKYPQVFWCNNEKKCKYIKCGDEYGCVPIHKMITTDLSEIDTVEEFTNIIKSELVDVKNRQTIQSYPTLELLYHRYLYSSFDFCDVMSSKFQYSNIENMINNVTKHWNEIVDQVVPSTTIWDGTQKYRNLVFKDNKFRYRKYTTLYNNPIDLFSFSGNSIENIEVIATDVTNDGLSGSNRTKYDKLWEIDLSCSQDFIGKIYIEENNNFLPRGGGSIIGGAKS